MTANIKGLPEWGTVCCIEPSPFDAETAYLVVDAHRLDDMRPYLWKTTDGGKTWASLSAKLPQETYLRAVREDPKKKGMLYLGTEHGIQFSTDDGTTWKELKLNLPTVAVSDLVVKDDDLVVATSGRSLWIFDDLTPLREMGPDVEAKAGPPVPGAAGLPLPLFRIVRGRGAGRHVREPAGGGDPALLPEEAGRRSDAGNPRRKGRPRPQADEQEGGGREGRRAGRGRRRLRQEEKGEGAAAGGGGAAPRRLGFAL